MERPVSQLCEIIQQVLFVAGLCVVASSHLSMRDIVALLSPVHAVALPPLSPPALEGPTTGTTTSDDRSRSIQPVMRRLRRIWKFRCDDTGHSQLRTMRQSGMLLVVGLWIVVCCFLPFTANPLHVVAVASASASFGCAAIMCSPLVMNGVVTLRDTQRSALDGTPNSVSSWRHWFQWRALAALSTPHFHTTALLLCVGLLVVVQVQYNLRYTASAHPGGDSTAVVDDNGMVARSLNAVGATTRSANEYGLHRALLTFEKVTFQMALFQWFAGLLLRLPQLMVVGCNIVHLVAILSQIPSSNSDVAGQLSGTIFTAVVTWFALPFAVSFVALWPFRSLGDDDQLLLSILADSCGNDKRVCSKQRYNAVASPVAEHPHESGPSMLAAIPIAAQGSSQLVPCHEDGFHNVVISEAALLASTSNMLRDFHTAHSNRFACLVSGALSNDDNGSLRSPAVVLDLNGVIVEANGSFCHLIHVDEGAILHRSLESVLEWFDVDEVAAVMTSLRSAARTAPFQPKAANATTTLDLCLKLHDIALESTWPQRVLIRGYGTPEALLDDPPAFTPRESLMSQTTQAASCKRVVEGRFAIVMDAVRYRLPPTTGRKQVATPSNSDQPLPDDRIVLRQPVGHSALDVFPVPVMLLQRNTGAILLWNAALTRMTELTPFDMLGANAYQELLGTAQQPFAIPLPQAEGQPIFPLHGDCKVYLAEVGAAKSVPFALFDWPSNSQNRVLLCVLDKSRPNGGAGGAQRSRFDTFSQHITQGLLKLVVDFNRQAMLIGHGPKQRLDRLEMFSDAVIQFAKQLAQSHLHTSHRGSAVTAPSSSSQQVNNNNNTTSTAMIVNALSPKDDMRRSSSAAVMQAPPDAQQNSESSEQVPVGAWGRLESQDPSLCGGCYISIPLGKEFTFGRSAKCSFTIADTFVSSIQFSIVRSQGVKGPQVILIDHSANGSYVNVKKVGKGRSCPLRNNDLITFRLSSGRFFLGFVFHLITSQHDDRGLGHANRTPSFGTPERHGSIGHSHQQMPPKPHAVAASAGTSIASGMSTPSVEPVPSKKKKANQRPPIEWKIGEEVLGKGGNAEVYLGINLTNGKLIAVKRVPLPKDATTLRQYQSLQEEISVLTNAEHPNIVHYYGSSQSETHLNILLEFVPGGSLRHLLDNFGALGDGVILSYLDQTLEGLRYLHSRNIVHSDIKSANILVTDKGKVKLTDFGTATLLTQAHQAVPGVTEGANAKFTVVGTLLWMAPELVRGESAATKASDIWSLGCAIVEMITSEFPWSEYEFESEVQIANLLRYVTEPPEVPDTKNPLICEIARKCLQLDPSKRPTCNELLALLHNGSPAAQPQADRDHPHDGPVAQHPHPGGSWGDSHELHSFQPLPVDDGAPLHNPTRTTSSSRTNTPGVLSGQWTLSSEYTHFLEEVDFAQRLIHDDQR